MKSARFLVVGFLVGAVILSMSPLANSQQGLFESYNPVNLSQPAGNSYLNLMVGLRKYFNSFTSWQFPNFQGPQDPLSRLEYPWDQTFLAIRGTTDLLWFGSKHGMVRNIKRFVQFQGSG